MTSILFTGDYLPKNETDCRGLAGGTAVVANLESAFSDEGSLRHKAYPVVLPTEALKVVSRGSFAALSVANNHVLDAGEPAFLEMVAILHDSCDTRVYGTRERPFAEIALGDLRCAVIGCLEKCRSRGRVLFREEDVAGLIRQIRDRFDRVFVTPHWGKEGEYASHPSPKQRRLARRWVDAGAHGVFGHHPHTVHGHERIDGRPVYYSLGNLLFEHEEGGRYPLTRVGLGVDWEPGPDRASDGYRRHFLFAGAGRVVPLDPGLLPVAEDYFRQISAELTDPDRPWTALRWARAVGPVYVHKSFASWQRRFQNAASFRTALLLALWSLQPTTLLLEWGSWERNRMSERRRLSFERFVLETAHPTEFP